MLLNIYIYKINFGYKKIKLITSILFPAFPLNSIGVLSLYLLQFSFHWVYLSLIEIKIPLCNHRPFFFFYLETRLCSLKEYYRLKTSFISFVLIRKKASRMHMLWSLFVFLRIIIKKYGRNHPVLLYKILSVKRKFLNMLR
jgi:hypothetical protein